MTGGAIAGLVIGLVIMFGLLLFVPGAVYIIEQQTVGIIERFGKYKRTAGPGIHTKWPFIDHVAKRVSLRINQLDLDIESKTKDNVFAIIKLAIQYLVPSPEKAFDAYYKLVEPHKQIEAWVYDTVRATVPTLILDDVFEKKDAIAENAEKHLKEKMELYGYEIVRVLVNDIQPDAKVKSAMNEINEQARLRVAAENKGEAAKILVIKAAEAQAESKRLQGEGIGNQRKAIVKAFKEAIKDFQEATGVSEKEVTEFVILTQYFDTLKELGTDARSKVVFMPSNPGAVGEFRDGIRGAFLQAIEATHQTDVEPEVKK